MNKPTSDVGSLTGELDGHNTVRYRPPYHGFTVTVRDLIIERHEGVGLTLDDVIRRLIEGWAPSNQGDPFDEDLGVWEANRCVALLRPGDDGKPVVTRFDDPGAGPVTSKPEMPPESGRDPEPDADQEEEDEGEDDPDGDEEDEPPAPQPPPSRGRREGDWNPPAPQPFLRQTLTVAPPWDTDFGGPHPVTVEVLILADGFDRNRTANRIDRPELEQGGWRSIDLGVLFVYMRAVM